MIAENGTTVITQDTIRTYKLLREIADEEVLIALSDKNILDQHGEIIISIHN